MERKRTKKELMVEILRDAILAGELKPGERLLQEELAQRFNVSSTPVREAIQQLVADGALLHSPYKGVEVAEAKLEDVQEVYLIRSVVESLATRLATPNLRISDVKYLRKIEGELHDQVEKAEYTSILKLNRDFHMLIYQAAGMPYLFQIIRGLWMRSPWDTLLVIPNRANMILQEHTLVLAAIESGDAQLAGQYMQEHIEKGLVTLTHHLRNI